MPADVGRALPVVVDFRAVNPLPGLLGPPTKVLDANEEIWRFFERFTR